MDNWKEILFGLFFFIINLILAVYQQWSTTDLLWSLWISSLILGYAYILTAILGMLFRGDQLIRTGGEVQKNKSKSPAAAMNVFLFIAALHADLFYTGGPERGGIPEPGNKRKMGSEFPAWSGKRSLPFYHRSTNRGVSNWFLFFSLYFLSFYPQHFSEWFFPDSR
jgi:hypothetical protein